MWWICDLWYKHSNIQQNKAGFSLKHTDAHRHKITIPHICSFTSHWKLDTSICSESLSSTHTHPNILQKSGSCCCPVTKAITPPRTLPTKTASGQSTKETRINGKYLEGNNSATLGSCCCCPVEFVRAAQRTLGAQWKCNMFFLKGYEASKVFNHFCFKNSSSWSSCAWKLTF